MCVSLVFVCRQAADVGKPGKKLPTVPESILKKRKTLQRIREARAKAAAAAKKVSLHGRHISSYRLSGVLSLKVQKQKRREIFRRAEKYVKEYRKVEKDEIRLRREAKRHGNFYVPDESKLAFIIRIRG